MGAHDKPVLPNCHWLAGLDWNGGVRGRERDMAEDLIVFARPGVADYPGVVGRTGYVSPVPPLPSAPSLYSLLDQSDWK